MSSISKQKQLETIVCQLLGDTSFELVLLEFAKTGKNWVLRIYIDRDGGITHEHCRTITGLVSDALENNEILDQAYDLEVSSPGVDRPLVKAADFVRFLGSRVWVKLHAAQDGHKVFTGELTGFENDVLTVTADSGTKVDQLQLENVAKATLKPILNFN